ncbi:MAG: SOS response-associated peptidase [Rubricoccaceae bacterium]|nr:SOS response-associated peptidase [Rubricoccaceae bacterium]
MCTGYVLPNDYQNLFPGVELNIPGFAPGQPVRLFDSAPIVKSNSELRPELVKADIWSLIPSWSNTRKPSYSSFNARIERLSSSNLWKTVFPKNRCLVPAHGFFERVPEKGSKKKRPYFVQYRDEAQFCFAGLWSEWTDRSTGEVLLTYTVVTTSNNSLMETIGHHRMPCIVQPDKYDLWLDPEIDDKELLVATIVQPEKSSQLQAHPVGYAINYRNEYGPHVVEPIGEVVTVD